MKLLLSIFILSSCGAYAQSGLVLDALDQNVLNDDLLKSRYKQISGSPYFYVEFTNGSVEFTSNQKYKDVLVRVDVFAGTVQLKLDDVITEYGNKYVKSLSLRDPESTNIINFKIAEINKSKEFVINYFDKDIKFYGRPDVEKRISTSAQTSYSSADQQDKFVKSEIYYIYLDGRYNEVKLNKKSILSVLGQSDEMNKFIKSSKIKFNRIDDLIILFEYFNDKNQKL